MSLNITAIILLPERHFFQTTQNGPTERNIACSSGSAVKMLHPEKGWESGSFSKNMQYYVRTYSNAVTPPAYSLHSLKGKISDLETNQEYAAKYSAAPRVEFITIPNAEVPP